MGSARPRRRRQVLAGAPPIAGRLCALVGTTRSAWCRPPTAGRV